MSAVVEAFGPRPACSTCGATATELVVVEGKKLCPAHRNGASPEPEEEEAGRSWKPLDLTAVLTGDVGEPLPMVFFREDGLGLFYRGRANGLYGEPESGKSWVALAACAAELRAGNAVLYLDFEDDARGVVARLRALGVPDQVMLERFRYVNPEDGMDVSGKRIDQRASHLVAAAVGTTLAVVDGVGVAYELHGWEVNSNDDTASFNRHIVKPLVRQGSTPLLVDHQTKARDERRGWALGAQAKKALVRGAAYVVTSSEKPVPGGKGTVYLRVEKDTPGQVRSRLAHGDKLAAVVTLSSDGEHMDVTVAARGSTDQQPSEFRPTVLMERISRWLELNPGAGSRELFQSVTGKREALQLGLRLLVSEEYVEPRGGGSGRRCEHHVIRPYRADHDLMAQVKAELGAVDVDDEEEF